MRFLVDENLPAAVAETLRADGHDAVALIRSAHRGMDDDAVWALAASERRILVTRDLGFPLPLGRPGPLGVVLLRLPRRSRCDTVVRAVQDLLATVDAANLAAYVTVVEPARIRRRPFARLRR